MAQAVTQSHFRVRCLFLFVLNDDTPAIAFLHRTAQLQLPPQVAAYCLAVASLSASAASKNVGVPLSSTCPVTGLAEPVVA